MGNREIEFGIYEIYETNDYVSLTGRINIGPLKVGDVFTYIFLIEVNYELTSDGEISCPSYNKKNPQSIHLEVNSMNAYNICFDELAAGMTALIKLSGTGKDIIRKLIGDTERIGIAIGNKV